MAARRTWLWVLVGILAVGVLGLVAVAGAGVYFVTRHISTEHVGGPEAILAFDAVTASFEGQQPLYEVDQTEELRVVRPPTDLPTADLKAEHLWMLAWDPDEDRLVKVSLPIWLLRLGTDKMEVRGAGSTFSLDDLELDAEQLERIGPTLLFDFRDRDGMRVLLWTR